jgi:hypothetical protein
LYGGGSAVCAAMATRSVYASWRSRFSRACAEFLIVPVRPASEKPTAASTADGVFAQAAAPPLVTRNSRVISEARPTMMATSSGQKIWRARRSIR